jgi:hypothetical protein
MAGETEVLGENLPRRHFAHQKSRLTRPGIEPGREGCQPYAPSDLYPQRSYLELISIRGGLEPRAIVRLEGLSKLKKKITSWEIEPATFRLVA